mmetsp:Transcript_27562/g.66324  ORF Transcript_27562/g.66324 Transcript_27562/m.66324 type:complete len:225 (-) Transcript_27562:57-731(-)
MSFGVGEDEASTAAGKLEDMSNSNNKRQRILPWNQLAEILLCLENLSHLPKGIRPRELEGVAEYNAWRWFALLDDDQLVAMAIKSLAKKMIMNGAEVLNFRTRHQSSTPPPLLRIFSGHDATLISLLCFLGIERPSVWPEYRSYLKMELLRDDQGIHKTTPRKTNSGDERCYYVLFSLNGELLKYKFGDKDGSNRFFIPWLNFEQEMEILRGDCLVWLYLTSLR